MALKQELFTRFLVLIVPSRIYIGQTGRTLAKRVKEHQRAVRTFDVNNSALAAE